VLPSTTDILLFDTARYHYWDLDLGSMEYANDCKASNPCRGAAIRVRGFQACVTRLLCWVASVISSQWDQAVSRKRTAVTARNSHSDRAHWRGWKHGVQMCIPGMVTRLEGGDVINRLRCCMLQTPVADSCPVCFCRLTVGN
jgi:hypothetical protein